MMKKNIICDALRLVAPILVSPGMVIFGVIFSFGLLSHANNFVVQFEDKKLQQCINQQIEKNGWGKLEDIRTLKCHNKGIQTLTGIEKLRALETLSLYKNQISQFDFSNLPHLSSLNMAKNRLKRVVVSDFPELKELYLFGNTLETLALHNLPKLTKFKGNSNRLTQFSYQSLPLISKIYLFDNKLEHIDIHSMPLLSYMDVRQNPMPDELYEAMDAKQNMTIFHDGNAEDWNH